MVKSWLHQSYFPPHLRLLLYPPRSQDTKPTSKDTIVLPTLEEKYFPFAVCFLPLRSPQISRHYIQLAHAMSERPLQSVYDALQSDALRSVYDEVANIRYMRPASTHSPLPPQSPGPNADDVPIPDRSMQPTAVGLDLRDLEYLDPESHLSCPICHIPFVDPVSVNCGHDFCAECLARYWKTSQRPGDRKPCPACRSTVTSTRCAPRLIVNMCNDVNVKCPSKACGQVVTRGNLQSHMVLYCPEQVVKCPNDECKEKTKRKHFLPGLCRHDTHAECECGDLVLLGGLEMHREIQCSLTRSKRVHCQQPVGSADERHSCELNKHCQGKDFGCDVFLQPSALEEHAKSCTMAKMAPHLRAHVANSLAPLQKELLHSQKRVKGLEEGIDKLLKAIEIAIEDSFYSRPEPWLDIYPHADPTSNPPTTPDQPPSPTSSTSTSPASPSESAEHRHLLALHENLRNTVLDLSIDLTRLTRDVEQVDARNSMLTMNETLRLKEELSLMNNGLYSTRTQVQWLLNRERLTGQTQAAGAGVGAMGRAAALVSAVSQSRLAATTTRDEAAGVNVNANANGAGTTASALTGGIAMRPARRTSGASQERVKL